MATIYDVAREANRGALGPFPNYMGLQLAELLVKFCYHNSIHYLILLEESGRGKLSFFRRLRTDSTYKKILAAYDVL
jgi:hypothetical protein